MSVTYQDCDGALWHVETVTEKGSIKHEIDSTLYKYKDKHIKPNENLGFKYHVLTYKENDKDSAEVLSAYIGDVEHFIRNHASAGYNGMMVKNNAIPKKDIKAMFSKILENWQFPEKTIRSIVRQV